MTQKFSKIVSDIRSTLLANQTETVTDTDTVWTNNLIKVLQSDNLAITDLAPFDEVTLVRIERVEKADTTKANELKKAFATAKKKLGFRSVPKTWEAKLSAIRGALIEQASTDNSFLDNLELPSTKGKRKQVNSEVAKLVAEKGTDRSKYSEEELKLIASFTGYGGLGEGDANEYYTPKAIASSTWDALNAKGGDSILDPCTGTGIFSSTAPKGVAITGVELNTTSGMVADILNGNTNNNYGKSFEEFSVTNNERFDGVVANVPFGKRDTAYINKDPSLSHIKKMEAYFIIKALEKLKEGKRGVFMTTSSTIQRGDNNIRLEMLKRGAFIGGVRLPSNAFGKTGTEQVVDILVFERHSDEVMSSLTGSGNLVPIDDLQDAIDLSEPSRLFLEGSIYFGTFANNIIGEFTSKEAMEYKAELTGEALHHQIQKDTVITSMNEAQVATEIKKIIKSFPVNTFGYAEISIGVGTELESAQLEIQQTIIQKLEEELKDLRHGLEGMSVSDLDKTISQAFQSMPAGIVQAKYLIVLFKQAMIKAKTVYRNEFMGVLSLATTGAEQEVIDKYIQDNEEAFNDLNDTAVINKFKKEARSLGIRPQSINTAIRLVLDGASFDSSAEVDPATEGREATALIQRARVADNGQDLFNFADIDMRVIKNGGIGVYLGDTKEGEPALALEMDLAVQMLDGMNYHEAMKRLNSIEANDDKTVEAVRQTRLKIEASKLTRQLDDLMFSPATISTYIPRLGWKAQREIINSHGADLSRVFRNKVHTQAKAYSEELLSVGLDVQAVTGGLNNAVLKSNFESILAKKIDRSNKLQIDYGTVAIPYASDKDTAGKALAKNRKGLVRGILTSAFNGLEVLLSYAIKDTILQTQSLKEPLVLALDKASVVKSKVSADQIANQALPLDELRGVMSGEAIERARLYQNEDARHFGTSLRGTMAQDTGLGKALENNELVLTPKGFVKNETLNVGDFVIGSDGLPTKVIGVYPQGEQDIYEVKFIDDTTVNCTLDHLWTVYERNGNKKTKDTLKTLSLGDLLEKPISKSVFDKRSGNTTSEFRYSIPFAPAMAFDNGVKLPLDAYLLGLLLGDGSFRNGSISFTNHRPEIIEKVNQLLPDTIKSHFVFERGAYRSRFTKKVEGAGKNELMEIIRELGLMGLHSHTKFIPDMYKYSSLENRRKLLQGLIDTDGHILKNGNIEYGSTSKTLLDDYKDVSLSVGMRLGKTSIKEKPKFAYKGEVRYGKPYYRITSRTSRVKRKSIISVTKKGREQATCIKVEAKDSLYIAGKGFNLTHNTTTMLMSSLIALTSGRAKRVLVITPNSVVNKLFSEFKQFKNSEGQVQKALSPEWESKIMVLGSSSFLKDIATIKKGKHSVIIAPHSVVNFFGLREETVDILVHGKPVDGEEDGNKNTRTPFYDLIGGLIPTFKDAKANFEKLGIDALFIDEQQAFKNGVASFGITKATSKPANHAITLQYIAEYIRQSRGDNSGVVSVTATPFTSSPSEILANLTLSGGATDSFGKPIHSAFNSHKDFIGNFVEIEEITKPKVNGIGVTSSDTFAGFNNFKALKDIVNSSVKFRDAEGEQARVKGLKVKPDHTMIDAKQETQANIVETFAELAMLNDEFKLSPSAKEKRDTAKEEVLDDLDETLERTVGETFGFINRVADLSNGESFARKVVRIRVRTGVTFDEIEKALGAVKLFSFGLYNTVKLLLSFKELRELEVRHQFREHRMKEVRNLAPDFLEVEANGDTYFNAYTIDDDRVKRILAILEKADLINTGSPFNLQDYPKYKILLKNIRNEYERKSNSKQLVFSDKPILTQRIIMSAIEQQQALGLLPDGVKVHNYGKIGGLKDDKSNGMMLQDKFNDSFTADIMVFGKSGITGVDFNKNVSAVHLMNIPSTPDIHHQAKGRGVRQGNDMDMVNVYKYFTGGTFDKFLDKLISGKSSWIDSLSSDTNSEDSAKVDTSSTAQIMAEAIAMFGDEVGEDGNKYTHEEMIDMFLEYQKAETVKEQKEIKSIRLKSDIINFYNALSTAKKVSMSRKHGSLDTLLSETVAGVLIRKKPTLFPRLKGLGIDVGIPDFPRYSYDLELATAFRKNNNTLTSLTSFQSFFESIGESVEGAEEKFYDIVDAISEQKDKRAEEVKPRQALKQKLKRKTISEEDRLKAEDALTRVESKVSRINESIVVLQNTDIMRDVPYTNARLFFNGVMALSGNTYLLNQGVSNLSGSITGYMTVETQNLEVLLSDEVSKIEQIQETVDRLKTSLIAQKDNKDYNNQAQVTLPHNNYKITLEEALDDIINQI